ncbi:MAG TPA: RHS repeat-associated core domain-containing protein, partial [bacterium]|nr:RHS repeat-associated core domain-containing protein [bacterium]
MKDRLGSIINIMDASENLKTTYSYDAFGQPTGTYHSGQVDCMYRFTGCQRHSDSCFQRRTNWVGSHVPSSPQPRVRERRLSAFYRARYYNQSLGRFFSRDPIFSLSSLYAYCHNSPANFTDPFGLLADSIGGDVAGTPMGMYHPLYRGPRNLPCAAKGNKVKVAGKTYTSTGEKSVDGGEIYEAEDGSSITVYEYEDGTYTYVWNFSTEVTGSGSRGSGDDFTGEDWADFENHGYSYGYRKEIADNYN